MSLLPQPPASRVPELLAPAGGPEALRAALAAGADAVYFGLKQLNARRGAENFTPESLTSTVRQVHAAGARAYLTLNIDISQRELGQAARHLEWARQANVDAVLVTYYPELEFHFSTQAGIASSAGMQAAAELGARRVVLARELTLAEVTAACNACRVAGEVFIQGAMCFGVSGRCLLSSWVGGRSGNRGACASPCRVSWQVAGTTAGRRLSMHDLSLLEQLDALRKAGVQALKIEGRLKKPEWVASAVQLYRRALAGEPLAQLRDAKRQLGDYTGRQLTSGFLDGQRQNLTGDAARPAALASATAVPDPTSAPPDERDTLDENEFAVTVTVAENALVWHVECRETPADWRMPLSRVTHPQRAMTLQEAGQRLKDAPIQGFKLARFDTLAPEYQIPRNSVNQVEKELSSFLHRVRKTPDGMVRVQLPTPVRDLLSPPPGNHTPVNTRILGERPDRVRIEASRAATLLSHPAWASVTLVLEQSSVECLTTLAENKVSERLCLALPPVFYETEIPNLSHLLAVCRHAGIVVEVNSWDGWHLARQAGVVMEGGPGLMVLNQLAARHLVAQGCRTVTVSLEADQKQVRELCHNCPVPLTFNVYGRPPLLQTRVELAPECLDQAPVFADARHVRMQPRHEGALTVFRPVEPYDLSDLQDAEIRVAHLMADLVAAPDPLEAWQNLGAPGRTRHRFNFARTLR